MQWNPQWRANRTVSGLQMEVCSRSRSSCPPSRSRGSQNNTAKILPRLNPNLFKQVGSLPLKSTRRGDLGGTILTPFSLEAPTHTRTCNSHSRKGGKITSTSSGRREGGVRLEFLQAARCGEAASCGRHGGRLSERAGQWRDYAELSAGSTPGCLDSRQWGRRSTSTFSAAAWRGETAPSGGRR